MSAYSRAFRLVVPAPDVLFQQVAKTIADADTNIQRRGRPRLECCTRCLAGKIDFGGGRGMAAPCLVSGGRIDSRKLRAVAGDPFAGEGVTMHESASSR